jgi:hypothetical protein
MSEATATTAAPPTTGINIASEPAPATTATALQPQQITVEQARGRRNQILASKELCIKLMEGDTDLRNEMHKLNETIASEDVGSAIQSALNGLEPGEFSNITTKGILAREEYASAARHLVPAFGNADVFKEFAAGATVTQARHNEAAAIKRAVLSDREWVRAYREGSVPHREQMTRLNATLVAPIAAEQKK